MKDVEGKKPESLKDCWRWIRGLLHDFANMKKLMNEQTRVIKKIELYFAVTQNYTSSNATSNATSNQSPFSMTNANVVDGYMSNGFNT